MIDTTRDIAVAIRQEVLPEGAKRLGLVIGIDRYQDLRLNLRCARADAEAMHTLMLDPECGLFEADNVILLADEDATRERIWRALAGLRRKAHKQDSVWIFYAGHGAPEGDDFYWVPHDGDVDDLYSTGLSRRDLNQVLDDLHAERIVAFMDCCHAAAMASQKHKTRSVMNAEAAFGAYTGKGRLIFAASDGHEKSVEIAEHGRGAFSYFLERGLRGEADRAGTGVVTADGLWQYLKCKVSNAAQETGNPQTPVRIGEETHDFALSLNPLEFGRRKRLAEAIKGTVGVGPDQLTTDEGRICLDVLLRGARTDAERDLMTELNCYERGSVRVSTLRRLLEDVRNCFFERSAGAGRQDHGVTPGDIHPPPILCVENEAPTPRWRGRQKKRERPAAEEMEPETPAASAAESKTWFCPGCGAKANSRNGRYCGKCRAFVHHRCVIKRHDIVQYGPFCLLAPWLYYCPICKSRLNT